MNALEKLLPSLGSGCFVVVHINMSSLTETNTSPHVLTTQDQKHKEKEMLQHNNACVKGDQSLNHKQFLLNE